MAKEKSRKEITAYRLKMARKMSGLSQNQIAKMLGLQRPAISEIEAGRRKVSAEEIAIFADTYDVDVSWLLNMGACTKDETQAKYELAAREINKLKPEDADRLLNLLIAIKNGD
jgi:transcriptional regulator with XRE-family HTH domain